MRAFPLLISALIAVPVLAAPAAKPSQTKIVSDWEMACDNINHCEATSLIPSDYDWENAALLSFERDAGPDGQPKLNFSPSEDQGALGGAYLTIDNGPKIGVIGPKDGMGEWAIILNADILAKLRKGNFLILREQGGKARASASLKGFTATMLYFDEKQGRVGTVTALAALGKKPKSSVPAAPAKPVIRIAARSSAAPYQPSKAEWAKLTSQAGCEGAEDENSSRQPEAKRLDARNTLLLIPCGAGAYNFSTAIFVTHEAKGKKPVTAFATMDVEPDWGEEGGVPMLVNADYDEMMLSSYAKGRGIGDCGSIQNWVWDGSQFRLTHAAGLGSCQGSLNYLTLWQADAK